MATTMYIPPVANYRNHLCLVLSYIIIHIDASKIEGMPSFGLEGVTNYEATEKLLRRIATSKLTKQLKITIAEMSLIYTCLVCMNRILVSEHDELLAPQILSMLPEGHYLRNFKVFRDEMLYKNCHLIEDAEAKNAKHNINFPIKDVLGAMDIK